MKRKKFYIILVILTVISLFSFAALCNQCGVDTGDKVDVDEDETDVDETSTSDENETTAGSGEDEADETSDDDADAEKEAPTITLEVYEGPTYSDDGDICYYRVEAIITGNPKPTVEFNRDDSGGAWSDDNIERAQVNINSPGETFTLTATATNSEGSAPGSIVLEWGCGEAEPEPEVTELEVTIDVEIIGMGFINDGGYGPNFMRTAACMGDNVVNKLIKGYLTFNISDLSALGDISIKEVEINIPEVVILNMPWEAASEIHVKVFYYGNSLNYPEDFAVGGEHVKTFSTSDSITDLNFSSAKLKEELQKAVDISRELFQLKFGLNGISNNDSTDCYCFYTDNTTMYIKYEIVE